MISREEGFRLLTEQQPESSLLRHCLESEAVMKALAVRFQQDPETWGLCGLLHDIDFPQTAMEPHRHGLPARDILAGRVPEEVISAIVSHNYENNGAVPPDTLLGRALRCGETVTGLVFANSLVRPEGYDGMTPKSLRKKMKVRSFAANVNRDTVMECETIGLSLDEFLQLAIVAMTHAAPTIAATVDTRA